MAPQKTSALVGLVSFGGLFPDESRAAIGLGEPTDTAAAPTSDAAADASLVGLVGFGGLFPDESRAAIDPDELTNPAEGPSSDAGADASLVGLVGSRHLTGAPKFSPLGLSTDTSLPLLFGGFGGFHGVGEPHGRAAISAADPQITDDTSTAKDADALLSHLRELGISVELEASGALRVTPASLLTHELRDTIKAQRDALAELLDAAGLRDDRRRCSECRHFRPYGGCAEAARGNMPGVSPRMIPLKDVLQRCDWFKAHRDFGGDY